MSAGKVLDLARAQLGTGETPPGSNCQPYSHYWHKPCEAWCADFATAMLKQAGDLDVPQSSYTPTLYGEYQKAGRSGKVPKVGALVFFQWPGSSRIDHVGIVESVRSDGSIVTIEGNSSDKVMRNVRRASIVGYGYPAYKTTSTSSPGNPAHHSRPVCSQGHGKGSQAVRDVQTQLNRHGAHLTVDADFGRLTDSAVRAFQKAHGLAQDGIVGVHTWAALDAK